ncbi:MAG TPA: hypothetical protein PL131_04450 [Methylotenera sp.]|nr:hypothetical protein [Methylotenera sp.]HPH05104.1 hypothetical protein [Methylotenera sp.]HPN00468.1 hypothetical protein [Methylotenera sp.]
MMFKQLGISSVELLLSLTIISSMSAYTLTMSEEVEKSIQVYQHETNVKEMLKKIKGLKSEKVNAATTASEDLAQENLAQPLETALEQMNESVEQTQEIINHS